MTGAARKLLAVAVLALLLTTASAGRTRALASDSRVNATFSSLPAKSTVSVGSSMLGCTPRTLARDLVIFCREPPNARMPIEYCCNLAVGTVARPSCFCLVKREPAFGMSPLLNTSNLAHLLARCGASSYLNQSVYNRCDGSYSEKQSGECPSPQVKPLEPGSCRSYKVLAYVGWATVAVVAGALAWLVVWRPAPATQIVYLPEVQLVTIGPENVKEDEGRSNARAAISDDDTSEAVLVDGKRKRKLKRKFIGDGKRKRNPNPKFIGGPWV